MALKLLLANLGQLRWKLVGFGFLWLALLGLALAHRYFYGDMAVGVAVYMAATACILVFAIAPSQATVAGFGLGKGTYVQALAIMTAVVVGPIAIIGAMSAQPLPVLLAMAATTVVIAVVSGVKMRKASGALAQPSQTFELQGSMGWLVPNFGPLGVRLILVPQLIMAALMLPLLLGLEAVLIDNDFKQELMVALGCAVPAMMLNPVAVVSNDLAVWQSYGKTRRSWQAWIAVSSTVVASLAVYVFASLIGMDAPWGMALNAAVLAIFFLGLSLVHHTLMYGSMGGFGAFAGVAAGAFNNPEGVSTGWLVVMAIHLVIGLFLFLWRSGRGVSPARSPQQLKG